MRRTLLVIVSGPPAAGKTVLGRRIAEEFNLPFINKDGIKESLFDTLGYRDREWSKQLGRASSELLWYFVETLLAAGCSLVVESNFDPTFAIPRLLALQARFDFEPLQIQCRASDDVRFERFKARAESGERHPGHVDRLNYDEFTSMPSPSRSYTLEIGGSVLEVDTTDFHQIEHQGLVCAVRVALARVDES
ncbi:MAG TPA: AAA family ATPase [Ardenticatenaceae bacterium]|nr:AAA family ATPase [Ardenticatenaceae bacterium]